MPEGDTVWRTALHLDRALSGDLLVETDFRVPAHATLDLAGHRVESTVARGKHLLTRISPGAGTGDQTGHTLHTHLKMEGAWHLYAPDTRWRRPAHEARVVLRTTGWTAVGFALGVVEVVAGAILDQRNLAGLGNLYRCELCFLAGVHPRLPVGEVPDLPRLLRRARAALEANKERVEQTLTGDLRRGRQTWVHRRDRQTCRRCGSRIQVDRQGPEGQERATYWCPACQPEP